MAMALMAIEADSRGFISCVKAGIEGGRGELGELIAARLCVRFWWSRIDQRWRKAERWRLGHCPMKGMTPGSLTGWRWPNWTSSEREATAESDKRSRPDREGGGGPWLGWKIREEAGPKPFLGLKSNRVKENQF
jgi:hypothetical protein